MSQADFNMVNGWGLITTILLALILLLIFSGWVKGK